MRIGVFGGSFNPIHTGHAIIVDYIIRHSHLDAIMLLVTPQNPLKQEPASATEADRVAMAELVARRIPHTTVCTIEMEMQPPYYTYKTLHELSRRYPDDEFTLIVGGDNWQDFARWRNYKEIIAEYQILVYPRRGYEVTIPPECAGTVSLVPSPVIELSSTMVRQRLSQGDTAYFYLPAEVNDYILERKLYQPQ